MGCYRWLYVLVLAYLTLFYGGESFPEPVEICYVKYSIGYSIAYAVSIRFDIVRESAKIKP